MKREVTAIVRVKPGHAILFGVDWNATVTGDQEHLDEMVRRLPFVVDITTASAA